MPKILTTVSVEEVSQWMMLLCEYDSEQTHTDHMATGNLGTFGHFTYLFRTLLYKFFDPEKLREQLLCRQ